MEIRHRIWVVQNDVALEHIHQTARNVPDVFLLVLVDEELAHIRALVLELVRGDGLGGRQGVQHLEDALDELARALARDGGNREQFILAAALLFKRLQILLGTVNVALVQRDQLRKRSEFFAVFLEFRVDFFEIFPRVAPLDAGNIDDVYEHARALDMAQEIVPQPRALRRALDEPGDIRRHKRFIVIFHNPQVGRKGGKMVVRDLRLCGADFRQECALAHVGEPNQSHVRNHLQFQNKGVNLRLFPLLREVGRVPPRSGKAHVALAAPAAAREQNLFAVRIHVAQNFARLRVAHEGAEGHGKDDVLPALAETVVRAAPLAVARGELGSEAVIGQIALVLVADDVHVAALAAVAAVRPAVGKPLEALKGVHSVAAVARLDGNFYLIRKQ